MGLWVPLSYFLIAASWITVVVGILIGWVLASPAPRQRLWRSCLMVSALLAALPVLFVTPSIVDDLFHGSLQKAPFLILFGACLGPVLCLVLLRQNRRPPSPDVL